MKQICVFGILLVQYYLTSGYLLDSQCIPVSKLTKMDTATLINEGVYLLQWDTPILLQKLVLSFCDADSIIAEHDITLHYVDASDMTKMMRVYSERLVGTWGDNGFTVDVGSFLYTKQFRLSIKDRLRCQSDIVVHGCIPSSVCPPNLCKNGGTCVGHESCACATGFIGQFCQENVSDVPFDDYNIISMLEIGTEKLLFTTSAVFEVTGNVSFIDNVAGPSRRRHSGGCGVQVRGPGGSCHFSSQHNSYGHDQHGAAHQASHSSTSSTSNPHNGYTFSSTVSFGHDHDHHHGHHMYTTHGNNHQSEGSSLHYQNGHLCMNEHHGNHHYHVDVPFTPKPNQQHTISSSFSQQYGACVYIDGRHGQCQSQPTTTTTKAPIVTNTPISSRQNLCFGTCGSTASSGQNNVTLSNIAIAGCSVPVLTQNALLGLFGTALLNLLLPHGDGTIVTVTTRVPAVVTTHEHTTVTQTLTSAIPGNATHRGPLCYDCYQLPREGMCTVHMQCAYSEVCLIMKDSFGYSHRCFPKDRCVSEKQTATDSCWTCCADDLCNLKCSASSAISQAPSAQSTFASAAAIVTQLATSPHVPTALPLTTATVKPKLRCTDTPTCQSLKNTGYQVCADKTTSWSVCPQTCNACP